MYLVTFHHCLTSTCLSLSPCRWERSVLMLQSGQPTSQQSLKKPVDVSVLRSMISSSAQRQLNGSCPQSWDSALLLRSHYPRGPCRSTSTTNGTRTKRRPDFRASWPLWPETGVCSLTVWTQREEIWQSLNTLNRNMMINTFQDPSKAFMCVIIGDITAETK